MPTLTIAVISVLALAGVVVRPWRTLEVLWAAGGATLLVLVGAVPWAAAARAVGAGTDVYLFLVGMMLLSVLAERAGLFDWLAAVCTARARGSAARLFLLVYGVGTAVTVFMSNDATAVVLTPAVLAVCRRAKARPLPYLMACALIANAASFVLPVSNPANLVVYARKLPSLGAWLAQFAAPSLCAIGVTFGVLKWRYRAGLGSAVEAAQGDVAPLSRAGRCAAGGVTLMAGVLLAASAVGAELGLPAMLAAVTAAIVIGVVERTPPWAALREVSWSILPLVAGLFVIVEALRQAGFLHWLTGLLQGASAAQPTAAALGAGTLVAFASNLTNNLPAGLVAGSVAASAGAGPLMQGAIAIGIDLGPNLSVTGSLATLLWLVALRKNGENVSAWTFLGVGVLAMPLALAGALGALWLQAGLRH